MRLKKGDKVIVIAGRKRRVRLNNSHALHKERKSSGGECQCVVI